MCKLPTVASDARAMIQDVQIDASTLASIVQASEAILPESHQMVRPAILTPAQRLERLRARIRAREADKTSDRARTTLELRRQLRVCEDAIALHSVVADLFTRCASAKCERPNGISGLFTRKARDQEVTVMTSEADVISVASAQSPAIQPVQRLEP